MKKFFATALAVALIATLATGPVWAKSEKFTLVDTSSLNGVQLEPGRYKINLNGDDEAEIYRRGKLIMTARVAVHPLENEQPHSYAHSSGKITEIRLKNQKVIFLDSTTS